MAPRIESFSVFAVILSIKDSVVFLGPGGRGRRRARLPLPGIRTGTARRTWPEA